MNNDTLEQVSGQQTSERNPGNRSTVVIFTILLLINLPFQYYITLAASNFLCSLEPSSCPVWLSFPGILIFGLLNLIAFLNIKNRNSKEIILFWSALGLLILNSIVVGILFASGFMDRL